MANHTKQVESVEIDLHKVKSLNEDELGKIKTDKRIIAGVRKNLHEVIILSEDYNFQRNVPTIDIRTFAQNRNTGDMVPTRAGFRLDPSQYSVLLNMLKNNEDLIHAGVCPAGTVAEGATDQSYHLEEQILS